MKRFQKIIQACIYLLAAFKCLAFYNFFRMEAEPIFGVLLGVCILYFIEAYLHVKFTGFIIPTIQFDWSIKKEHRLFISSEEGKEKYSFPNSIEGELIISSTPLKEVTHGRQSLKKDSSQHNGYRLIAYGVLQDNELMHLVTNQDKFEQRRIVLTEGIKLQILQLNLNN